MVQKTKGAGGSDVLAVWSPGYSRSQRCTPARFLQYEVREGREAVMPEFGLKIDRAECPDLCSSQVHMEFARSFDSTKKKPRPVVVVGRDA